jgi:hypothetical protein
MNEQWRRIQSCDMLESSKPVMDHSSVKRVGYKVFFKDKKIEEVYESLKKLLYENKILDNCEIEIMIDKVISNKTNRKSKIQPEIEFRIKLNPNTICNEDNKYSIKIVSNIEEEMLLNE